MFKLFKTIFQLYAETELRALTGIASLLSDPTNGTHEKIVFWANIFSGFLFLSLTAVFYKLFLRMTARTSGSICKGPRATAYIDTGRQNYHDCTHTGYQHETAPIKATQQSFHSGLERSWTFSATSFLNRSKSSRNALNEKCPFQDTGALGSRRFPSFNALVGSKTRHTVPLSYGKSMSLTSLEMHRN